ncbi:MAG: carbamoyltransferase HypF [Gammaproteobacteria bacterium]|nr:MAG: carbamoyltransferase HypF [Gammaproteobacteria bacterium]
MPGKKIILSGKVQGVGFRPFVYRLANEHHIYGTVINKTGQVEIIAQGTAQDLTSFETQLINNAPPLAQPRIIQSTEHHASQLDSFKILHSESADKADIHIPVDFFTCNDCLEELQNKHNRRYRYPFINCTQCGPRYTLITRLPYDRPNTSMADFALCSPCHEEYINPLNRRFHAQPLACDTCGPSLSFIDHVHSVQGNEAALQACLAALTKGHIIAVKGIGGYHLMCDALNEQAVQTLRQRKLRPHKPFAVLFPWKGDDGTEMLLNYLQPDEDEQYYLSHPGRPIVLIASRKDNQLAASINPGLKQVGAMLPYSPLHFLLSQDFKRPLVATSANFSGEPVITDNQQAQQRLQHIADGFLHHNRPILRPADDSVVRIIHHKPHYLRLGRGVAPLELELPFELRKPVLALGGHMKNTIALAWDKRVVISPHIGDLGSKRSMDIFQQVIDDLQQLYNVQAKILVCDQHPDYASSRWAQQYCATHETQLLQIFHHHAHAGVFAGEYPEQTRWLIFAWDGTGYGMDGDIWGGETFIGTAGNWQRITSFHPLRLLGGDKASLQPWRSAAAMAWSQEIDWQPMNMDTTLAKQAFDKQYNCFQSSAVGRLFDAAAAFILGIYECSFDGQAPMQLEQIADTLQPSLAIPLPTQQQSEFNIIDWSVLIHTLMDSNIKLATRSAIFHASLGMNLVEQALSARELYGDFSIGLGGGVFQNKILTEFVIHQLEQHQFRVFTTQNIPCNDAGLCYGQIIEAYQVIAHG